MDYSLSEFLTSARAKKELVAMYRKRLSDAIPAAMHGSSTPRMQYAGTRLMDSYAPRKRSRLNDGSAVESSGGSQTYNSRSKPPASIDRYVPTSYPADKHYQARSASSPRVEILRGKDNLQHSKIFNKADFRPGMIIRCALHGMYECRST